METKKLLSILNLLMVAVERKAVVSQYDHVVFFNKAMTTFNGKVFISHPVDVDLNCSVVAEDLISILKTIEDETVTLSVKDDKLLVHASDVSAELSTEVYEDNVVKTIKYLNVGAFDWENDANKVPLEFIEGLANCRFSVSKDVSDSNNTFCIHIIDNAVESSDGFRCTEFIMGTDMEEMLIPSSSAIALSSFDPVVYIKEGGWVHFMNEEEVIFSVAIIEGTFPDINLLMDKAEPEIKITLPIQISNILGEFGKLSSGESDVFKFMEVSIRGEKVYCTTEKQGCTIKKTIPFPGEKRSVTFSISPTLLNSVLAKTNTIGINYTMNIASFEAKGFRHIVTLPQMDQKEVHTDTGTDVPF